MNARSLIVLSATLATGLVLFSVSLPASAQQGETPAGNPPPVPTEELPAGSQVLAGGPVHEAFAKPLLLDPQAPIIQPNQPPADLQEVPPEEKPDGASIVWVPGYWAWDTTRNDFIWVSGCWRNAPPNTYWVPGHWLQVDSGWEWIGGFWKPIDAQPQQEIEYLPAPPTAVEVEAQGPPPQPDQIWVPGCWYWVQDQYEQRHGYWMTQHAGWVWVPSHYAWTPRGYIFCPGHWDYDMDNRGVLFTPTYFPPDIRVRAGFVFSPSICVDLGMLRLNLFSCPRYHHYYFGDYYDDTYRRAGIYPWYQCQTVHTWYDPLFVYDRWHFGQTDPHWAANQERGFELRRVNLDLRPARTFVELQVQMSRLPANRRSERPLVQSVKTFAASQSTPIKFERISTVERQQLAVKSQETRNLRDQRSQWEGPGAATPPATKRGLVVGTKPKPEMAANPPVAHPTTRPTEEVRQQAETKPAPEVRANPPVVRPTTRPSNEARQPQFVPPQAVRVTRPEREVMSNPPSVPKPSESRYIEKTPPSHPVEERPKPKPTSGRGVSDGEIQKKDLQR